MRDLVLCPHCPGYRLNLSGPHSPHWVRSPAGIPELRDCELRLVAENDLRGELPVQRQVCVENGGKRKAPSVCADEASNPTSTL